MSILYIETNSHLHKDIEWTWYVDNEKIINIWHKYKKCNKLIVIAPYEKNYAQKDKRI